jgi:hypothetical protein
MTHLTPDEFEVAFDSLFRRSAFRLEMLDRYVAASEEEPFRRFLAGEPQDPSWREPWAQYIRAAVRDGKRMERVHVIGEPVSDYLRFEMTCGYPASVAAGESVRILRQAEWPKARLPERDFWLFNDRDAVVMDYGDDGRFLGAETISAPEAVAGYRHVRDLAMQHSVPLNDYLTSLGMKEAV